jgi:restriction system protein
MLDEVNKVAPTKQIAKKIVFAAFKILKEAGGQLERKDLFKRISSTVKLSEYELGIYEKTGYVRWESILHFYSINCNKAGFLRKKKGVWYLTEEGEKAITLGEDDLFDAIVVGYRNWKSEQPKAAELTEQEENIEDVQQTQKTKLELLEDQALTDIKGHINSKNAYEFQDIVAALLRAMGYYTPFVSPRGKDGGVDIIAYNDPLGATTPRLKVQIKHKPNTSIPVDDIRSLTGLLNKDGDIGLFVTSGDYTSEAKRCARESHRHIKLLNIDDFIELWQQFYIKLNDEEKNMLPLLAIYFLGTND